MKKIIYPSMLLLAMIAGCAKVTEQSAPCTGPKPSAPIVQNVVVPLGSTGTAYALATEQYASVIWTGPGNFAQTTTNGQLTLDFESTSNYGLYTASIQAAGCTSAPDTFYVTQNPIPVPPPCTIAPANYNTLTFSTGPSMTFEGITPYGSPQYTCSYANYDVTGFTASGQYTFDFNTANSLVIGTVYPLISGCGSGLYSGQAFATISSYGNIVYKSTGGNAYINTIAGLPYVTFCGANFLNVNTGTSVTVTGNIGY